jgi:7-cyano-7-deazaguanine synthase
MNKVVLSYSGGMDSTVLLYKALHDFDVVHTVTFNYGQRHHKEIEIVKSQIERHSSKKLTNVILDLPFFQQFKGSSLLDNTIDVAKAKDVMGDPQTVNYVPFRNTIFLSILAGYAESVGAKTVWYGAAQADSVAGFYDGSIEFLDQINDITKLNRRHVISIEAPLIDLSKKEIIKLGQQYDVDYTDTWTCYEGKDVACGECTACALRLKGFVDAGIPDPVPYSKVIPWDKLIKLPAR